MNIIHPSAIIHAEAKIGDGNRIGPFVVIGPNVSIGSNNVITSHASIGLPGEHKDFFNYDGEVIIGDNNTIREFVTINAGTTNSTIIGDHCIMLRGSHAGHDVILENMVTVSCGVLIGGHTRIMRGANLGLGTIIHQNQVIGSFAMTGMGTIVTKKTWIYPGELHAGNPAKMLKVNSVGLRRFGLDMKALDSDRERFLLLKQSCK